jgi:hypothetical protein
VDIAQLNRDWLLAWSDKDVPRLLRFYSADVQYRDPAVPAGIVGQDALRTYLTQLFASTPPMWYEPETVWAIDGGFCGRWFCTIDLGNGKRGRMRGFDLCRLENGLIAENEVYTHNLPDQAR